MRRPAHPHAASTTGAVHRTGPKLQVRRTSPRKRNPVMLTQQKKTPRPKTRPYSAPPRPFTLQRLPAENAPGHGPTHTIRPAQSRTPDTSAPLSPPARTAPAAAQRSGPSPPSRRSTSNTDCCTRNPHISSSATPPPAGGNPQCHTSHHHRVMAALPRPRDHCSAPPVKKTAAANACSSTARQPVSSRSSSNAGKPSAPRTPCIRTPSVVPSKYPASASPG
jgi:hypothetical protein